MTKLVLSATLSIIAFVFPDPRGSGALILLLCATALVAGVLRRIVRPVVAVSSSLAVALFAIHSLFYPGNRTPLITIGPVTLWEEGVAYAVLVILRILVLVLAFLTTIATTHPKHMMVALNQKGMSPKLTYVFLVTLQFVPEMQRRATAILEAQQARGLDVKASILKRLRAFIAVMGPLIGSALIASETRALALEARGFTRRGPHTYLVEVSDPAVERSLRWASVALAGGVIVWRLVA